MRIIVLFLLSLAMLSNNPNKRPSDRNPIGESLEEALGTMSKDMMRRRSLKDKYNATYDQPKPKRNEGMRGTKGEIFL